MNRTKFSLMLIAVIILCLAISVFAKTNPSQDSDAKKEIADGAAKAHESEGVGLPDGLALEYQDIDIVKVPPAGDLSSMTKQAERKLGTVNGEEINIALYSDSNYKVHGILDYMDRQYILRDLGYAHDMDSIEAFDLQLNSQDPEGDIILVSAVGSDILGYKYVFCDKENNTLRYYHNWGVPEIVDIDRDGTDEVLLQFKGLHNNAPDGSILVFDDGKFMVSSINEAVYKGTEIDKDTSKVSAVFKLQDDEVLVELTLYGGEKVSKLYRLEKEEMVSLQQQAQQAGQMIYYNSQYNFYFLLPEGWRGYSIVTGEWEGQPLEGLEDSDKAETGPVINIRNPEWTEEDPRQDIPVMVFTLDQWDMLQQEKFHIGAAPIGPRALGRNDRFVFALPARYNYAFPTGYEEVESILEGNPLKPLWEAGSNDEKDPDDVITMEDFQNLVRLTVDEQYNGAPDSTTREAVVYELTSIWAKKAGKELESIPVIKMLIYSDTDSIDTKYRQGITVAYMRDIAKGKGERVFDFELVNNHTEPKRLQFGSGQQFELTICIGI